MKTVGVKDLKARLSEYLRAVRSGDTLLITDRAEVIAELRPLSRRVGAPDSLYDALDALADRGEVTRARVAKSGWNWKPKGLGLSQNTVQDVVNDIRAERDEA